MAMARSPRGDVSLRPRDGARARRLVRVVLLGIRRDHRRGTDPSARCVPHAEHHPAARTVRERERVPRVVEGDVRGTRELPGVRVCGGWPSRRRIRLLGRDAHLSTGTHRSRVTTLRGTGVGRGSRQGDGRPSRRVVDDVRLRRRRPGSRRARLLDADEVRGARARRRRCHRSGSGDRASARRAAARAHPPTARSPPDPQRVPTPPPTHLV